MAFPVYTNTLTDGQTAVASQVMQNFNDILNGFTDGTKDSNVAALTAAGTATFNGNVVLGDANSDTLTVTAKVVNALIPNATDSYDLGTSSLPWRAAYLDHGSTDGGAVYFNSSTSSFVKSNAAGTALSLGGFTTFTLTDATTSGTTELQCLSNSTTGTSKFSFGHTGSVAAAYMQYNVSAGTITWGTNGGTSSMTLAPGILSVAVGGGIARANLGAASINYDNSSGFMYFASNGAVPDATTSFLYSNASGRPFFPNHDTTAALTPLAILIASGGQLLRSTSSARFKTDIEAMPFYEAESLYGLRPVSFKSKCTHDDPTKTHEGFIAEEVAAVNPKLAYCKKDEDGIDQIEGVDHIGMIVRIVALLGDIKPRLEALERFAASH